MKTTSKILIIALICVFICIIIALRPHHTNTEGQQSYQTTIKLDNDSTTTPITINVNNIAIHGNTDYQYWGCKARIICSDTDTPKITVPNSIKQYIDIKESSDSLIITSNFPKSDYNDKMKDSIEQLCIHIYTKTPKYIYNQSRIDVTVCDLKTYTFAISGDNIDFNNCKIGYLNSTYESSPSFFKSSISTINITDTPELWKFSTYSY